MANAVLLLTYMYIVASPFQSNDITAVLNTIIIALICATSLLFTQFGHYSRLSNQDIKISFSDTDL